MSVFRRLILFKHVIADINECAVDNGGCRDQCCNTIGSYYCRCHAGRKLEQDGRGCEGSSLDCLLTDKERDQVCVMQKRGLPFIQSQSQSLCWTLSRAQIFLSCLDYKIVTLRTLQVAYYRKHMIIRWFGCVMFWLWNFNHSFKSLKSTYFWKYFI